jgi:hypothetical protein
MDMTDEDIFDLAEKHGWMDDFGRWNFKDDGLISFALEVLRINAEQQEPACWINGKELAGMRASATHWGASEWKTNLGLKPIPDDVPLYTAPVMSEKNVRVSDKWVGLADEEIDKAWRSVDYTVPWEQHRIDIARAIEAKLKEKNT